MPRHRLLNTHRPKAVEVSLAALRGATRRDLSVRSISTLQLGHDSRHVNVVAHLAAKFVVQSVEGTLSERAAARAPALAQKRQIKAK